MKTVSATKAARFTLAEKTGAFAYTLAFFLFLLNPCLSAIPLAGFVLLCFAAPFFPGFGFYLPIISRGKTGTRAAALTVDDGPDPLATPPLLDLLDRHQIKAAFFVAGKNAEKHPELIREILNRGHAIGNHTYGHDPLIMFKSRKTLSREIERAQQVLKELGVLPRIFRPPVGITNPRLRKVLLKNGLYTVNFSCRGFDMGNRRIHGLSDKILRRVKPDDIILLHDRYPGTEDGLRTWLQEVEKLISGLKKNGYDILQLETLIHTPAMISPESDPDQATSS